MKLSSSIGLPKWESRSGVRERLRKWRERLSAQEEPAWLRLFEQTKFLYIVTALILLFSVLFVWLPTPDSAAYLSIAQGIAEGRLQRFGSPCLNFGLGYPLLIAPAFLLGKHPFWLISLSQGLLAVGYWWLVRLWAKRLKLVHAELVSTLCALNVGTLFLFRRMLSEVLFMPLWMFSVLLLNDLLQPALQNAPHRLFRRTIFASLAVAYLALVRHAGVCLTAGFVTAALLRVWRKDLSWFRAGRVVLPVCICAALAAGGQTLYTQYTQRLVQDQSHQISTYLQQLSTQHESWPRQLWKNLTWRIESCGRLLLPGAFKVYGGWTNPLMPLYLCVATAVLLGWFFAVKSTVDVGLCAAPFYLLLYLIWPFDQGTRFMVPLLPVMLVSLFVLLFRGHRGTLDSRTLLPAWKNALIGILLFGTVATSAVYWVKDWVKVRKVYAYQPAIEKIRTELLEGRAAVDEGAGVGLQQPVLAMLSFELNYNVPQVSPEDADGFSWLVISNRELLKGQTQWSEWVEHPLLQLWVRTQGAVTSSGSLASSKHSQFFAR